MASLEDEQDVAAAKIATAEAGADKAEFDEAAKWAFLTSFFRTTKLFRTAPVSLLGSIDEAADEKYIELINQVGEVVFIEQVLKNQGFGQVLKRI